MNPISSNGNFCFSSPLYKENCFSSLELTDCSSRQSNSKGHLILIFPKKYSASSRVNCDGTILHKNGFFDSTIAKPFLERGAIILLTVLASKGRPSIRPFSRPILTNSAVFSETTLLWSMPFLKQK